VDKISIAKFVHLRDYVGGEDCGSFARYEVTGGGGAGGVGVGFIKRQGNQFLGIAPHILFLPVDVRLPDQGEGKS